MAIKDLLVAFDGNDSSIRAVRFAAQMAGKYGASITGMHVYRAEKYESHIRRWIPDEVMQNLRTAEQTVEKSIEASFNSEIKMAGFKGTVKWIAHEGLPD
ncbi:MAG: universal stress protein, partial [Aestuariivirgaceae bacterium]